jgi:hypothetical protein
VKAARETFKQRHGLVVLPTRDPFGALQSIKDVFGLLDAAILGPWSRSMRYVVFRFTLREKELVLTGFCIMQRHQEPETGMARLR